jgi:nucleoside-diphosphate-sugar epimerase
VEASGLSGASVVLPNPVWGLKPVYGVPLAADAPRLDSMDAASVLGQLRNEMEDQLEQNAALRNIRALVVRSPTFVGRGVSTPPIAAMRDAARGAGPIPWYAPLDVGHAFIDVDDVAEVALRLLEAPGRPAFQAVNLAGHHVESATEWARLLAAATGRPAAPVRRPPSWHWALRALWDREARAFRMVLPHWEGTVLLDDRGTRALLPHWIPTPMSETLSRWMQVA